MKPFFDYFEITTTVRLVVGYLTTYRSYNRNVTICLILKKYAKQAKLKRSFLLGALKGQPYFNNAFLMFVHQFVIWLPNRSLKVSSSRDIVTKYLKADNVSKWRQTVGPNYCQLGHLFFHLMFRKRRSRGEYQHLSLQHNRAGRNRHQAVSGSISKHAREKNIVHINAKDEELTFQNKTCIPRFPRWLSTILLFFINFSELRHVLSRWRDSSLYTKQEKQPGALKTQDHKSTGENTSSLHRA